MGGNRMLITSGYNFQGYDIVSYLGHESVQVVLGTGFFSSFDASISDFCGYLHKWRKGEIIEIFEFQDKKIDITPEQLASIRKLYGNDAVNKAYKNDLGRFCI